MEIRQHLNVYGRVQGKEASGMTVSGVVSGDGGEPLYIIISEPMDSVWSV